MVKYALALQRSFNCTTSWTKNGGLSLFWTSLWKSMLSYQKLGILVSIGWVEVAAGWVRPRVSQSWTKAVHLIDRLTNLKMSGAMWSTSLPTASCTCRPRPFHLQRPHAKHALLQARSLVLARASALEEPDVVVVGAGAWLCCFIVVMLGSVCCLLLLVQMHQAHKGQPKALYN